MTAHDLRHPPVDLYLLAVLEVAGGLDIDTLNSELPWLDRETLKRHVVELRDRGYVEIRDAKVWTAGRYH